MFLTASLPIERFSKVLLEQQQDRARREQERVRLLTADPFDMEAQAKIEEDIRYSHSQEGKGKGWSQRRPQSGSLLETMY